MFQTRGHRPSGETGAHSVRRTLAVLSAVASLLTPQARPAEEGGGMPMGTPADVAYAERLWSVMQAEGLVGDDAESAEPFFGGAEPHGMILEVLPRPLIVGDHRGFVVVKRNYAGPGVSVSGVARDRTRFLQSVTVMLQREPGYDPDNQNWFWVKYRPDGRLFEAPFGGEPRRLAGRIFKGDTPAENGGCLWCHRSAGGGDYIFYRWIEPP